MIEVKKEVAVLNERSRNLEKRLESVEKEIDDKLKNIETKIDKQRVETTHELDKIVLKMDVQRKETNVMLDTIVTKIDGLSLQEEKRKHGLKTMGLVGGAFMIIAGFVAWLVDKWDLILKTFFVG